METCNQIETDFSQIRHIENTKENQEFYDENEVHFNKQCKTALNHLLSGKGLTCDEARDLYGIRHLPRRICTLRESGIDVKDRRLPNRCKEYYLNLD